MTGVVRSHGSPCFILGINAYHGDVSAVLVRDGELVVALEEERFRRIKHWAGFPTLAIQRCLAIAGISGSDISHVGVSRDPAAHFLRKALFAITKRPDLALIVDRVRNARTVRDLRQPLAVALDLARDRLPPVHRVEHHPSHAASAFFVSPFADASVATIDGFGDFVSTSMAVGRGNKLQMLDRVFFPHSLGMLYTAVTQYLGFPGYGDEFKVMGLAAYGKATRLDDIRRLVCLKAHGRFELSLQYFRHWNEDFHMEWDGGYPTLSRIYSPALERLLGPARAPDGLLTPEHENIARSLQAVHEECAFHVLNGLWERTKNPRLCLAGGCAMNSVANGKVRENTPFTDVYIQPAAGDNGTALGAAYWVWHQLLGAPRSFVMEHGYWGTEYEDGAPNLLTPTGTREDNEWQYSCKTLGCEADVCRAAAEAIAAGKVVGWFQGRMEWGARALGNRSILADPRRADMRELINTKIKFRERFRPFAPSILEEALHEYFVGAAPDAFMQQVYAVRADKRSVIPAVVHADGTGRLQTVRESGNPRYYRLIKTFGELTGVPVVLNTSFNENEPIVDTPEQALDCFLRTKMDVLVIGNTIVQRTPAPRPEHPMSAK